MTSVPSSANHRKNTNIAIPIHQSVSYNNNDMSATAAPSSSSNSSPSSAEMLPLTVAPPAHATMAATSNKSPALSAASFKLLLLLLMVLQNSSAVLVGRYTRSAIPKDQLYAVSHLVMVVEVSKLILACGLEFWTTGGRLMHSLRIHVLEQPADALKVLVPALLYLIQNTLLYTALSNLTAPIFQVTYQGKLVTTALVSVLMLKRSYSVQQWLCLVFLSLGVAIVVLGEQQASGSDDKPASAHQNLALGLTAVTISCLSSALAGVYFEMVLKRKSTPAANSNNGNGTDNGSSATSSPAPEPSLWMRNIQLALYSVVIAAMQNAWSESRISSTVVEPKSYLHGFTGLVWVLVALQAGGGMLVAAVIKYADNVLKGLATGVSVVLATSVSVLLFNTELSQQFFIGAVLILASVYWFSNPLPAACGGAAAKFKQDTELKPILPK